MSEDFSQHKSAQTYTSEQQALQQQIEKYQNTGHLDPVGWLIVIASLTSVLISTTVGIYNVLRLMQLPTKKIGITITKQDIYQVQAVENILRELKVLTKADRVCIGLFHNGTAIGSLHFTKMTVRYEAKKAQLSSFKAYKDIDIDLVKEEILRSKTDEFIYYDIEQELPQQCLQYLAGVELERVYSRLLADNKERLYGILEIQYSSAKSTKLSAEDLKEIEPVYLRLLRALDLVRRNKLIPS